MSRTLFEKIIAREIPADIVYEDDLVLAFRDIKPQAPVHVLIVPKKPVPRLAETTAEDHRLLGHLLLKAAAVADQLGLKQNGYRLVINNGPDGGESVPHLPGIRTVGLVPSRSLLCRVRQLPEHPGDLLVERVFARIFENAGAVLAQKIRAAIHDGLRSELHQVTHQ